MKKWSRYLAGVIAVFWVFVAPAGASGETCTLELKRLEPPTNVRVTTGLPTEYLYRSAYPQSFFMQVRGPRVSVANSGAAEFSKIVKKEPAKYESKHPFRGVAKLGSEAYGFVLDAKDSKSKGYSRLYFDLNHNGDLTDDKVIEAEQPGGTFLSSYSHHQFPRVDVTINADGTKVDYAFLFSVYSQTSEDFSYASASLNAAAYREGEITLDGKQRHVVLLDFNSNGRFDDEFRIQEGARYSDGRVVPQYGDMLLVDPEPSQQGYRSPYDVTTSPFRQPLSKLVSIDGRFYDLQITAAGDKLTLTPCSLPLGRVTSPSDGFCAVLYGDKGFVKISGGKSEPVSLPEGEWKLLSYTIDQTGYQEQTSQPAEQKERSLLQVLAEALIGSSSSKSKHGYTLVSAQATKDSKPVRVRKGRTVALPFGPPFRPVVTATSSGQTVSLALSIVGSAGEVCTNLMVDGKRPDSPEFTISTPKGEEVEVGKFKYG